MTVNSKFSLAWHLSQVIFKIMSASLLLVAVASKWKGHISEVKFFSWFVWKSKVGSGCLGLWGQIRPPSGPAWGNLENCLKEPQTEREHNPKSGDSGLVNQGGGSTALPPPPPFSPTSLPMQLSLSKNTIAPVTAAQI